MKEKRYYIAYGSNLNVRQMRMRCPNATILGTANLTGWELLFKGSKTGSYLTIEECENGTIPVVIWEVTESDEAALDRYEGFPTFYYKKNIKLQVQGHPHREAQNGDGLCLHHARGAAYRHPYQLLYEDVSGRVHHLPF